MQALGRAAGVAAVAVAVARPLRDLLGSPALGRRGRRVAWGLLLTPFLTPSLLVGYVYLPVALALVREPGWKEVIYDAVLVLRFAPVAVLALTFSPPPLSAAARHSFGLLPGRSWLVRWIFRVRGAGRGPWAAGALVGWLAYGEFDLAAMWNVRTWTQALFDAQAGGLALGETQRLAREPLLGAAGMAAAAGVLLGHRRWLGLSPAHRTAVSARSRSGGGLAWAYLALAAGVTAGWPLARLLPEAVAGAGALAGGAGLWRDIAFTALLAGCAAGAAGILAAEGGRRPELGVGLAAGGLPGALLLALTLLWVFQWPGLRAVYNTPLPLLAGSTLHLLPAALALGLLRRWTRPGAALHLAGLLGSRRLRWELDGSKAYWAGFLLFCWAYFDLTLSALLAPAGLTTVGVRVFNLMHYGRTPALSAMLVAAVAVPGVAGWAGGAAGRRMTNDGGGRD